MLFPLSPENFRPRTHLRPTNEDPAAAKYDNPGAVAQLLGLFKIPGSPSGIIKKLLHYFFVQIVDVTSKHTT